MDLAEEHRAHITGWFFECPYATHVCFGDMYVADQRFRAYYDAIGEGVAEHLRGAIHANAAKRGG